MTVAELIKELEKQNPNAIVFVEGYGYGEGPAREVTLRDAEDDEDLPSILIHM